MIQSFHYILLSTNYHIFFYSVGFSPSSSCLRLPFLLPSNPIFGSLSPMFSSACMVRTYGIRRNQTGAEQSPPREEPFSPRGSGKSGRDESRPPPPVSRNLDKAQGATQSLAKIAGRLFWNNPVIDRSAVHLHHLFGFPISHVERMRNNAGSRFQLTQQLWT